MFSITWQIPGRLLLLQLSGNIRPTHLQRMNKALLNLLNTPEYQRVHVLIQTSDVQRYPYQLSVIKRHLTFLAHDNLGWVLAIGEKTWLHTLLAMCAQLAGTQLRRTRTENSAWRFLHSVDSTLKIPFELIYGSLQRNRSNVSLLAKSTPVSNSDKMPAIASALAVHV